MAAGDLPFAIFTRKGTQSWCRRPLHYFEDVDIAGPRRLVNSVRVWVRGQERRRQGHSR